MSDTADKKETKDTKGKKTLTLGSAALSKIKKKQEGGSGIAVEIRRSRRPSPSARTSATAAPENSDERSEALKKIIDQEKNRKEDKKPQMRGGPQVVKREPPKPAPQPEPKSDTPEKKTFRNQDATPNEKESYRDKLKRTSGRRTIETSRRDPGKLTVSQALSGDYDRDRGPSLAALKRKRARERGEELPPAQKISRDITLPETISVQELSNRMSEQSSAVIKVLMGMGVIVNINQTIDADTAELVAEELGHKVRRVTEADVETGLDGEPDAEDTLQSRPPVVTIMGHVDHGKTSLLDAMRKADVAGGEAGGITQHIGAYQIRAEESGDKITFLDTPGHAAFTEMRSRGANVTDIVVLVVAANDSIMPQTIEAINHAKAAEVPIIVAINKIDLPDANPDKVKQDLLQHEVIIEDMGGDVLYAEISAKKKTGLDKLEEAILLQAEVLDKKANPDRKAVATVVESKVEQGRGAVATVLVTNGTLKVGDIFVVGSESGKVRALINDHGKQVKKAIPGQPVEVLGLSSTPASGDVLNVVENDAKAREIANYRARMKKDQASAASMPSIAGLEQMMEQAGKAPKTSLALVIKTDVYGSIEAITGSLAKIEEENEDVAIKVLHTGIGGITESDISLAGASDALIVGFNVRANAQAQQAAKRDGVDIRYYNIIYNVIDDVKELLSGMLAPKIREEYIGNAQIREVFNITKVGKIGGCMITKGIVERGAGVRLLRDDVVIHEGKLKTLKRFKDEVKEVREGMECGMAFENYDNIQEGDEIECFRLIEEKQSL